MDIENKRDYQKEYQDNKIKNKRYIVKVPLYMANAFDEKLKKEGKKYSDFARESIEKYLKKQ